MKILRFFFLTLTFFQACVAIAACSTDVTITKPDSIYTNHGNGTVTDNQTGLMWMRCSLGLSGGGCAAGTATTVNWKQALEAAQAANSGVGSFGYKDWRLPTTNELVTLVELACYSPAINTNLFPSTLSNVYWSSTPLILDTVSESKAWSVNFNGGAEYFDSIKADSYYVRLVRGGR